MNISNLDKGIVSIFWNQDIKAITHEPPRTGGTAALVTDSVTCADQVQKDIFISHPKERNDLGHLSISSTTHAWDRGVGSMNILKRGKKK